MITARRESNGYYDSLSGKKGNVAVLEREEIGVCESTENRSESIEDVRERMKKNLEMILNYDKPAAVVDEPVQEIKEETVAPVAEAQDEDIRPTTTTMQFGDADVNQMFNELREHEQTEKKTSAKTKFIVALYALAVTVIFALIIINTGVLSVIKSKSELKQAELDNAIAEYNAVSDELAAHGDDYVIDVAVNELGMIN